MSLSEGRTFLRRASAAPCGALNVYGGYPQAGQLVSSPVSNMYVHTFRLSLRRLFTWFATDAWVSVKRDLANGPHFRATQRVLSVRDSQRKWKARQNCQPRGDIQRRPLATNARVALQSDTSCTGPAPVAPLRAPTQRPLLILIWKVVAAPVGVSVKACSASVAEHPL